MVEFKVNTSRNNALILTTALKRLLMLSLAVLVSACASGIPGLGEQEVSLDELRGLASKLAAERPKTRPIARFYARQITYLSVTNSSYCPFKRSNIGADYEVISIRSDASKSPVQAVWQRVGDCAPAEARPVEIWFNDSNWYLLFTGQGRTQTYLWAYKYAPYSQDYFKPLDVSQRISFFKSLLGGTEVSKETWDDESYSSETATKTSSYFYPSDKDPMIDMVATLKRSNELLRERLAKEQGSYSAYLARRAEDNKDMAEFNAQMGAAVVGNIRNNAAALDRVNSPSRVTPTRSRSADTQSSSADTRSASSGISLTNSTVVKPTPIKPKRVPHAPYVEPNPFQSYFFTSGVDKQPSFTFMGSGDGNSRNEACTTATQNTKAKIDQGAGQVRYDSVSACYCAVNGVYGKDVLTAMAMDGRPDQWQCTMYAKPVNLDNSPRSTSK